MKEVWLHKVLQTHVRSQGTPVDHFSSTKLRQRERYGLFVEKTFFTESRFLSVG